MAGLGGCDGFELRVEARSTGHLQRILQTVIEVDALEERDDGALEAGALFSVDVVRRRGLTLDFVEVRRAESSATARTFTVARHHFALVVLQDLEPELFRQLMDVNYFGTVNVVRAVVPSMIERRRGSIVGVSSAAGLVGVFGYSAYTPTKFAVRGFLETLRAELAPYGIHVGCSFPPDTDTPQLADEEQYKPKETKAIASVGRR